MHVRAEPVWRCERDQQQNPAEQRENAAEDQPIGDLKAVGQLQPFGDFETFLRDR